MEQIDEKSAQYEAAIQMLTAQRNEAMDAVANMAIMLDIAERKLEELSEKESQKEPDPS